MDIFTFGLTAPAALASVALIGYVLGVHQRHKKAEELRDLSTRLDEANSLISQIESVSDRLRRSMASHHTTVTRCSQQIQTMSEIHGANTNTAHHMHLQDVLQPTQRLSDDIAHAYDELRQHTQHLKQLRQS